MNIQPFSKLLSRVVCAGLIVAGALAPLESGASIVIGGTRVVYKSSDSEVTVKLSNAGEQPALTQVWLDKGDPHADPSTLDLPFMITPPMSRIDPGKGQTVRVLYTGEPLAKDRETAFWLNVLEVPPKPTAAQAGANYVQLAFRSRIKFFFRPDGLPGSADDAPGKLVWRLDTTSAKPALTVANPTPYHITIIEAHVGAEPNAPTFDEGTMVEPGGQQTLRLSGPVRAGAKVMFTTINDYGGPVHHEATLP
ncbi:fimbria/pilus periplasmic chaperone [Paraburkholderia tropica]|uniref:fimbria/pilus periplasmic chaperone n=1 Tax=Paraburkholderia tropica TaxID=92647 RepID=UPI0015911BF0|nr:fimbria/pilus periplasmic chaperone [Paraburkholderia tropica]